MPFAAFNEIARALVRGPASLHAAKSALLGDIRSKGLVMTIEIVVDKEAKTSPAAELQAVCRIIELGLERGIALDSRRTANGRYGEWLMVAPPLIVTVAEIDRSRT